MVGALRVTLSLVVALLASSSAVTTFAQERSPSPLLPLGLVQRWCYSTAGNECVGNWSQPNVSQVVYENIPGRCDVAFAIPRVIVYRSPDTGQTDVYTITYTTNPTEADDRTVYQSPNVSLVDNVCRIVITLLP